MNNLRVAAITAMFAALCFAPVAADSSESETGPPATAVTTVADPVYVFSLRQTQIEITPHGFAKIGELTAEDLLLESDEEVVILTELGELRRVDREERTEYDSSGAFPEVLLTEDAGRTFDIVARARLSSYVRVPAGRYEGTVRLRAVSRPEGKTVWEGSLAVALVKPEIPEPGDNPKTDAALGGLILALPAAFSGIGLAARSRSRKPHPPK